MTTILLAIFSTLLLIAFIIMTIVKLLGSEPRSYRWPVTLWVLFLISGGYTLYRFIDGVERVLRPRTGTEIYTALLGKPNPCVDVKHWFDPIVPVMDDKLMLHFRTCPAEIRRITAGRAFTITRTTNSHNPYSQNYVNWWRPEALGDSMLIYDGMERARMRGQVIITNTDSTEAYFLDM